MVGLAGGVEYFVAVESLSFLDSDCTFEDEDELEDDEPTDSLNESVNDWVDLQRRQGRSSGEIKRGRYGSVMGTDLSSLLIMVKG